jgi:predicted small secreted protein
MKSLTIVMLASLALSACNTVQGVGKDLGKAGDAISHSAEKTKEKL